MVLIYTFTSVLSAFLVFFIQPVVAKLALPVLGGIPSVWSGCMLFFQVMLLAGYLYAHALGNRCSVKQQLAIHLLLLLVAVWLFPVTFDGANAIDSVFSPLTWLLMMLFYSVGLPFFVISASAPLLQKWYSHTDYPDAKTPYFLYAASNIGSMTALLSYPLVTEPFVGLLEQVRWWEIGITTLCALFFTIAFFLWRHSRLYSVVSSGVRVAIKPVINIDYTPIDHWRRVRWVLLSFVPASLLYGVTAYITTDIASAPLLWVMPLTLYLATFIIVFSRQLRGVGLATELHLPIAGVLILLISLQAVAFTIVLFVHLIGLFVISLSVHGELSKSKPIPQHLTEFYLWMSVGGVLGGLFNTLVAPFIFNDIMEYVLILLLSCILRVPRQEIFVQWRQYGVVIVLVALVGMAASFAWMMLVPELNSLLMGRAASLIIIVAAIMVFLAYNRFKEKAAAYTLCLMLLTVTLFTIKYDSEAVLIQERSVFGVNKVIYNENSNVNIFIHGTTLHGIQLLSGDMRLDPMSYYTPLREVFKVLPDAVADAPVAIMGLGVGTIACYGKEGQVFDMFEIDPLVEKIARNPNFFTYMRDCLPEKHVILGDARQKIRERANGRYGLIVMDAFNSDAIPTHLITKEAVELYLEKLAPEGLIAVHVSNQHIELRPVLAALADELEIKGAQRTHVPELEGQASVWVVLARSEKQLTTLMAQKDAWGRLPEPDKRYVWTDDFSNVILGLRVVQRILGIDTGQALEFE